jgi:phage gp36-like protein
MSYCTLTDLKSALAEEKLIQLTDDENEAPVTIDPIDTDCAAIIGRITDAIDYADQMIDGYLRSRYTLPLSAVPKLVQRLSVDLALYYLYARRFDVEIPEGMTTRYNNATKLLQAIQAGKVSLGTGETEPAAPTDGSYSTNKTSDDRLFSKEVLDGF